MKKQKESKESVLKELQAVMREETLETGCHKQGVFGIEARVEEVMRKVKLELIKEEIRSYNRGYDGNRRKCPNCGESSQVYKGDSSRLIEFECGEVDLIRSYYVCKNCKHSSFPLDEKLGLVSGKEQGQLRKKLSMLAVVTPYAQAPEICETMFGTERHSTNLRRLALREAERYESSEANREELSLRTGETVYMELDGHMCPTREARKDAQDQGFREAKAVVAYHDSDVVEVSNKRKEILHRILKAKVTSAENFLPIVRQVYDQANGKKAETVVVLADGAKWIWSIAEEVAPEAIQILDFTHAKQHLYDFAKLRFFHEPSKINIWVEEQVVRLCADDVDRVIAEMKQFSDIDDKLRKICAYFENNAPRMKYKTFRALGLNIGSGAIESAGKQLASARFKGAGMRWNVKDLNPIIALRAAFLDRSWRTFWKAQETMAA